LRIDLGTSAFLPMFIVPFFVGAISNGEEIGWRGFAAPAGNHSALVASLTWG
jgi:membrane protease YdiL (CAAX protease family)